MGELSEEERISLLQTLQFLTRLREVVSEALSDEGAYEIIQQVVLQTACDQLTHITTQESENVATTLMRNISEQIEEIEEDIK